MKIKDWHEEERPREKVIRYGARSVDNSELLAILLRTGNSDETAVDLARKILFQADNSLNKLSGFSLENLTSINGIGKAKALTLIASFEIASRMSAETPDQKPQIHSSASVAKIISPMLKGIDHEECWILFLNRANRMILKERISIGGISSTVVDIKIIIKKAVEKLASSIIIIHNHPSGNPYPGEQDRMQTRYLKEAAALFDISLLDHIIIAGDKYYSFSDEEII